MRCPSCGFDNPPGMKFWVTVLFADLKGSMELLADRDPEEARQLLDTRPALWRDLDNLTARVEQAWMALLAGSDLVAQEILVRQLQTLKQELEGPSPTPLERLLVERIVVCWLQVQHADLVATRHSQRAEPWVQQRQDRLQHRLLAAVKALA
jgi:hypothetical protein